MKNAFTFLIAIVALMLVSLGCGQTEQSAPKPDPNAPAIIVNAETLTREYAENEIAADGKYKNKTLEVSGKISDIAEVAGNMTVQLEGHKENGIALVSVMCSFAEKDRQTLAALKKGQSVTLAGTGDGKTLGFYVGLNDCRIK